MNKKMENSNIKMENTKKHSKLMVAIIIVLAINLCATVCLGVLVLTRNAGTMAKTEEINQYVMYIGTNDKDTYEQIISTDDAKSMIDAICCKYLDGYTLQDAIGSWVDDNGMPTHENTIVCYFDGADEETIHKIADDVITELNQNAVLIEKNTVETEYYHGAE